MIYIYILLSKGYRHNFGMKKKPTNADVHIRIYYSINVAKLLNVRVSTTLVSILREVLNKGHITRASKNITKI